MTDTTAIAYGRLPSRISVNELRSLVSSCGLTPSTGDIHHVSVEECSHFLFRENGDGGYLLSADADNTEALLKDAALVSAALTGKQVEHSFEVYDDRDRLVSTFAYAAA
jgi:hypothetical protein